LRERGEGEEEGAREREGPAKSKEKGLITLQRVIHCAPEITTEPSKSSFNAAMEEKETRGDDKRETDIHRHGEQAKSKAENKDHFPKSFIKCVISDTKLGCGSLVPSVSTDVELL